MAADRKHNLDELKLLVCRDIDGDPLSAAERAQLEAGLAESAQLRTLANVLRQVDRMLKQWAGLEPQTDWQSLAQQIVAGAPRECQADPLRHAMSEWAAQDPQTDWDSLADDVLSAADKSTPIEASTDLEKQIKQWADHEPQTDWNSLTEETLERSSNPELHRTLADWAACEPQTDWSTLTQSVLARTQRSSTTRPQTLHPLILRLGLPLAAAAAIAIAMTAGLWRPWNEPVGTVRVATFAVSEDALSVSFSHIDDRIEVAAWRKTGGFASASWEPIDEPYEDVPPL